jgi:hypothetical protein
MDGSTLSLVFQTLIAAQLLARAERMVQAQMVGRLGDKSIECTELFGSLSTAGPTKCLAYARS